MSTGAYPGPRPDRVTAQRKREDALARLTRVRGVTLVAAGTLTAAVAGVVSAASGRTLGKHYAATVPSTAKAVASTSGSTTMPALASASQLGLGSPGSVPQAGGDPNAASGGGSSNSNSNAQAQAQAQAAAAAQAQQQQSAPAVSGGS